MKKRRGRMGCSMIENDNRETNTSILNKRQEYVFKAAVLLVCAGILAMVLFSGPHEIRTADQCGRAVSSEACQAPATPYPPQPAKGAVAPFGAGLLDPHAGN
jgi:hypothetical protein